MDAGLLANNPSILADAYRRVYEELTIKNAVKVDGIRADGSFGETALPIIRPLRLKPPARATLWDAL